MTRTRSHSVFQKAKTMTRLLSRSSFLALAALLTPCVAGEALAAGSTAGVTISNTATVGYSVGGVAQPDVSSNTATFVVDMLVNLVVAEVGGAATTVTPGQTGQISTFTVTNTSNAPLDFRLTLGQAANGVSVAFSGTDGADATNVHVYVDSNGNNTYDAGVDVASYIDELAADASVTVFVVADIPVGVANNVDIGLTLTAFAATGGTASSLGADLVASAGVDVASQMDIVFGDAAGFGDVVSDGKFGARDAYHINAPSLIINKLARVVSDPVNGTSSPRAVPGAVIEYCISVQNLGSVPALNLAISDTIPAHMTYIAGSMRSNGTVSSGACNSDGAVEDDDNTGADESDGGGGFFASNAVRVALPTVAVGNTLTAIFRATVD